MGEKTRYQLIQTRYIRHKTYFSLCFNATHFLRLLYKLFILSYTEQDSLKQPNPKQNEIAVKSFKQLVNKINLNCNHRTNYYTFFT